MPLPTYRAILVRVLVSAVLLASVVGIGVFFAEMEIADERVSEMAKTESAAFVTAAHQHLVKGEEAAIEDRLRQFMAARTQDRGHLAEGTFIVAEVYALDRSKIAEYVAPDGEWAEDRLKAYHHRFPKHESFSYERFYFSGKFFIQAIQLLKDDAGQPIGYFESVFELSAEKSGEIIKDTATVVGASVLSILVTALVLLPIFVAFNRGVMGLSRQLLDANIDILTVLGSAIAKRDSDTHAHNYRVTVLAIRLAEALGLDAATIRRLVKGAFLHDVGKIAIPDQILLKPGKLDEQEFAVMKTHVVHGLDIIRAAAWLDDAVDVVGGHHEKYDGNGYPNRVAGDEIPITARIFAIADVFDALTSRRPYKEPMPFADAMRILKAGSGSHFDPSVLGHFVDIAELLHNHLTELGDEGVEIELRHLVGRYFAV